MEHSGKPMKQSELDKNLRAVAKAQAKTRGWKSVGGMPYWQSGLQADAASRRGLIQVLGGNGTFWQTHEAIRAR
jgi:hypothetical protein